MLNAARMPSEVLATLPGTPGFCSLQERQIETGTENSCLTAGPWLYGWGMAA